MDIALQCRCGKVQAVAEKIDPSALNRAVCLCADCQAYAHYLGQTGDVLDQNGGTDIFPVTPRQFKFTKGQDQLRCLRLTEKGMIRWFTNCCRTPIANSMASSKFPFAGVVHTMLDHANPGRDRTELIGPIRARIFGKQGIGPLPRGTSPTAPIMFILKTVKHLLVAYVRGEQQPSPFFSAATGLPTMKPYVLNHQERQSLRKFCGPHPQAT